MSLSQLIQLRLDCSAPNCELLLQFGRTHPNLLRGRAARVPFLADALGRVEGVSQLLGVQFKRSMQLALRHLIYQGAVDGIGASPCIHRAAHHITDHVV